jgi:hypothetical protein
MRYSATDESVVESPREREFRPERWLDGEAAAAAPKRVSMPFGAGLAVSGARSRSAWSSECGRASSCSM